MANGLVRQRTSPKSGGNGRFDYEPPVDAEDPQRNGGGGGSKRHSSPRSSPAVSRVVAGFLIITGMAMIFFSALDFLSNREVQEPVMPSKSAPVPSSLRATNTKTEQSNPAPEAAAKIIETTNQQDESQPASSTLVSQAAAKIVETANNNQHEAAVEHRQLTECGIWMAPSSLVPFPGFGIFTTREISFQESILHQPDAVSIPLHDMKRRTNMPLRNARSKMWNNVFSNYVWDRGVPDHNRYDNPPDMVDFQPGFGSLPNHHCILASLGEQPTEDFAPYSDGLLYLDGEMGNYTATRKHGESPGTGAFSYSLGRDFYSRRNLKPGDEIFLNYGHCTRPKDSEVDESHAWQKLIIYPVDIREAARILKLYEPFGSKTWSNNVHDLVEQEKQIGKEELPSQDIVVQIVSKFNTQAARKELYDKVNAIKSQPKVVVAADLGKDYLVKASYEKLATRKLWFEIAKSTLNPAGQRDPAWIKENGQCLENLVPKKSTIPDAGFGAFAQYEMKKDEIVVPAPVLHVVDKEALMLYERDVEDPEQHKINMSLLMNYCFGDSKSSMLLCPMTSAMLLNHCSTRDMKCGHNGPNAEIRWSSGWDAPSHEWRNQTLENINKQTRRLLSFEVVATRDIAPGEEVFIDYGIDWEMAWMKHTALWKPPSIRDGFVSAQEANEQKGPIMQSLISGDLRKTVEHPYLLMGCQYWEEEDSDSESESIDANPDWEKLSDKEILDTYGMSGKEFVYPEGGYTAHDEHTHWPCSVLREEGNGRYTVRIHMSPLRGVKPSETDWDENEVPRILTNYTQDSIHFFVKANAIDQKLPNVFRHHIGLPDGLFPEQWKNQATQNFTSLA